MKLLKELPESHPMRSTSERGLFLIDVATRAHDKIYDVTREFKNLNPDVQKMWIEMTDAILLSIPQGQCGGGRQ